MFSFVLISPREKLDITVTLEVRFCELNHDCSGIEHQIVTAGHRSFTRRRRTAARQLKPQSSSAARVGLAEESTEESLKRARLSQLTYVNRQNSADTDPPRLRKYFWHKRGARLSIFP